MKKVIISSIIIALVLTIVCGLVNYICATFLGFAPLSVEISGGDCIEYIGFGVNFLKLFPLSVEGTSGDTVTKVNLDFISFIISFVIIFAVVFIISLIIYKSKNKKATK